MSRTSVGADLTVDVAICTYTLDRWDLLVRSVESALAQQRAPRTLVICVDHNAELVVRCREHWGEQWGDLDRDGVRIVVVANAFDGRLGSARNTALLYCTSDVVAFLDDDAVAAPDWLERLVAVYTSRPEAVAVGGAPLPDYGAPRPDWFPAGFDWVFGCHYTALPSKLGPTRHLIGANMSVRRDAILAEGGFHADDHDDMDLSHRIAHTHGAGSVLYEPRATVRHYVSPQRLTWTYFWRRCFFVNRSKVGAFADMGEAGNLGAEVRFGLKTIAAVVPAAFAALRGRRERLLQALVAVVGVGLAGVGYLAGRVRLARGRRAPMHTAGLTASDLARVPRA